MPCGASSPGLARGPGVSEGASLVGPQGPSLLWRGLKTLPICSPSPSPDARSPSSPGLRGSLPPSVLPSGKAVCWWRLLSQAPGGREGNDLFPPPRSRSRARGLPAPPRPRLQHPPRGPAGPSPRRAEGAGPPPSAASRAWLARGRAAEGSVTRAGGGHFQAGLGDLGSPPRVPLEARPQQSASAGRGAGGTFFSRTLRSAADPSVALSPSAASQWHPAGIASAHVCPQMKGSRPWLWAARASSAPGRGDGDGGVRAGAGPRSPFPARCSPA